MLVYGRIAGLRGRREWAGYHRAGQLVERRDQHTVGGESASHHSRRSPSQLRAGTCVTRCSGTDGHGNRQAFLAGSAVTPASSRSGVKNEMCPAIGFASGCFTARTTISRSRSTTLTAGLRSNSAATRPLGYSSRAVGRTAWRLTGFHGCPCTRLASLPSRNLASPMFSARWTYR